VEHGERGDWNSSTDQHPFVFQVPLLNLRIEGHTSYAKKSTDGGAKTSNDRATEVVAYLVRQRVPGAILHPVGKGSSRPANPKKPGDAVNRRVEIHVMSSLEAKMSRMIEAEA
jgi:flagellar motor protein MotB